jgi:hypothetical protein
MGVVYCVHKEIRHGKRVYSQEGKDGWHLAANRGHPSNHVRGGDMKEKTKDLWRAYLSELDRCKRKARKDYEEACDRWDHYSQEAPQEVREEFE